MKQIYIAGGLFSEAQIAARLREGELTRHRLDKHGYQVFNPIEQPYNDDKSSLPTPEEIYINDYNAIAASEYVIFDMSDEHDSGMAAELGIVAALQMKGQDITPIGVYSDIRIPDSNRYSMPSYGTNHFVLGIFNKHGHVVRTFEEAIDLIENSQKID